MLAAIQNALQENVSKRIWLFSDLQQSKPSNAKQLLRTAISDMQSIHLDVDQIWYLGDAVVGDDGEKLNENVQLQVEMLSSLMIPLRFVLGNHDMDYVRMNDFDSHVDESHFYFRQAVKQQLEWKTTEKLEDYYFQEEVGPFQVYFLSDHASIDEKWLTTNGKVYGDSSAYPYDQESMSELRAEIANSSKPVILASHYAFPGGARPSKLWEQLLPLPDTVCLHVYGHCHLGDAHHGKEMCFRKISTVDHQRIPQINISSLENRRGESIRSVFIELYTNNRVGVFFRNHQASKWEDFYLTEPY